MHKSREWTLIGEQEKAKTVKTMKKSDTKGDVEVVAIDMKL